MSTSESMAIQTEHLSRVYKIRGTRRETKELKQRVPLDDVNLDVRRGEFFGVLAGLTAGFSILAFFAFRYFDRVARDKARLDAQSNF